MVATRLPENVVRDKVYHHATVRIDGTLYVNCTFDECKLVFKGEEAFGFEGCNLIRCEWAFDGPAETVLLFLASLYRMGPEGKDLVEGIFQSIRSGDVFQGYLLPNQYAVR